MQYIIFVSSRYFPATSTEEIEVKIMVLEVNERRIWSQLQLLKEHNSYLNYFLEFIQI